MISSFLAATGIYPISPKHFSLSIVNCSPEGIDTKYTSFVVMAAILAVILAAGCTSAPVKETSTTNVSTTVSQPAVRYVELQFSDGTKAGGKYVSETPGFVTIVPMYMDS